MRRLASTLLVLLLALAACGASDEDKVTERVNVLYDGFAEKDAKKVCESLTKRQQEMTARGGSGGGDQSCEDVMGLGLGFLQEALKGAGDAKVTGVRIVGGERARAKVELKGRTNRLGLLKENGEWLVSDFNVPEL